MVWTIGIPQLSTFPLRVHSGPLFTCVCLFAIALLPIQDRTALLAFDLYLEIANSNFPLLFSTTFPQLSFGGSDLVFLRLSVFARKLNMTGSIRIFGKLHLNPKITLFVFLKVKLPNMTDWHILPGFKIDILIACCRLPVSLQNAECCSRYSASGNLQKFAADFNFIYTPKFTTI